MSNREAQGGTPKKARFIDPPNVLRQKCGYGGIEPTRLQKAETFIDENDLDFAPFALRIMERLEVVIRDCKSGKLKDEKALDELTKPIMELKANGGMFKYVLMTEIADIVLNFLENISEINKDVFEIIDAHQNTLQVIIATKLRGSGGREGRALADELYQACIRYYKKYKINTRG